MKVQSWLPLVLFLGACESGTTPPPASPVSDVDTFDVEIDFLSSSRGWAVTETIQDQPPYRTLTTTSCQRAGNAWTCQVVARSGQVVSARSEAPSYVEGRCPETGTRMTITRRRDGERLIRFTLTCDYVLPYRH